MIPSIAQRKSGFWSDLRVLVTGGEGFLGSHVVEHLAEAGCQQIFIPRHEQYDLSTEAGVDRLFHDIALGCGGWQGKPGGPAVDVVIHLAGYVGGAGANEAYPADMFYRNLMMGTLTLDRAYRAGVRKLVTAASGCGYPEAAPLPLREASFWDGFPYRESAPYALAKRMLHVQSLAYWRQYRFLAIVTVPGNAYGPYDNFDFEHAHVIPALVRKFVEAAEEERSGKPARVSVWGSGAATRDFVYAGDVAEGILRAAETYEEPTLVNLSAGEEHSIKDVVEALRPITGFAGELLWDRGRPDGQARRHLSVDKARLELGWSATTPLAHGLKLTADWFRANRAKARLSA